MKINYKVGELFSLASGEVVMKTDLLPEGGYLHDEKEFTPKIMIGVVLKSGTKYTVGMSIDISLNALSEMSPVDSLQILSV
jgi:hypothetical protein